MTLIEVGENKQYKKDFLMLPVWLYATDQNWIRPLDQDIESVFDPKKNKHFAHGECVRWILKDDNQEIIGRVAAFFDHEKSVKESNQPTGGMGFFECIENQEAAFLLFDACKNWLASKGMEAMDGPINFGDRDAWWGLMIKGWEFEPTYKMPWTKQYYIPFFENYGFQDYFRQFVYLSPINAAEIPEVIKAKAERIYENPNYVFRHIEKDKLKKYASDFKQVFNEAWAKFPGVKAMTDAQANQLVQSMRPIIDEELIWFAYIDERPIAFFIAIPDINQIVKHLNGQFNWWAKIKFMLMLWRGVVNHTCGVIFGVTPDYQGRGVESAIALRMRYVSFENPHYQYQAMDMNWIGDFNPRMNRFVSQICATITKEFITYRYLFDRTKPFKRCPSL